MLSSLDQVMDSQTQENGEQVEATESQRKRLKVAIIYCYCRSISHK
jgi:hypothetical protein